ncbi:MAG: FAD-dependent oxidoreductase [Acidobacteriota bacterium]|nr:FAD-dependent oxidoreductase [Acidobacteriota bacterium]
MADHADNFDVADVAIIGAGVIGCSVAFHLARLGGTNVLLIDKEPLPGSGSTSKANGGIRAQFTTDVNIAMSLASMDILDALEDEIGQPSVYRKAGYLFLTSDPARFGAMKNAAAFQKARGVAVEVLDAAGVRARAPYAAGEIAGGTFGPRDGFIDPGALTNFFLREATRAGVRTRYGAEVTAIDRDGSGTFRLTTAAGDFRAAAVVDAAGPFAGRVAALLGVDVPVVPVRRHLLLSGPCPALPPEIPMTIDADTGVLIRREGSRVLIAYSNPEEPPGFNLAFDPDFPLRIAAPLDARFPAVGEAGLDIKRSWTGLYEVTPDHHAILGPVAGVPGFLVVAGFSGHGIMHAPAAGRAAAEMLLCGRSVSVDVSALSLERFARGEAIHESMVL